MCCAAQRAYTEGKHLLASAAAVEIYEVESISAECQTVNLKLPGHEEIETLNIGPQTGYLYPAKEAAIVLCTVGTPLTEAMRNFGENGDYLMMYYLDVFGVKALADLSQQVRLYLESYAEGKGWGAGPFLQPGSVKGWDVAGQRDLYRLAHGEQVGIAINDAHILVPQISDSSLIGMGPHYLSQKAGSMCRECPRYEKCLWRRENGGGE